MLGKTNQTRTRNVRQAGLSGRLLILTVCVALLTLISLTSESPTVTAQSNNANNGGFTPTPGNVDTSGWSDQNKSVLVNFSLERADKRPFRELKASDIVVTLNGHELPPLPADSLTKRTDSEPVTVLFMIDVSGSMIDTHATSSYGANKLSAAKESLRIFVSKLGPNDKAEIWAFDTSQYRIQPLTNDKKLLSTSIEGIQTNGKNTSLYASIRSALDTAKTNGIKNVIILSDGMEDPYGKGSPPASVKAFQEEQLSALARQDGISLFAIAVGASGAQYGKDGVDFESLEKIAKNSNGGRATLVDIPQLNSETGNNPNLLNKKLTEKLTTTLEDMKKSFRFGYGLRIPLPNLDEGEGDIQLKVTADRGDQKVNLPIAYHLTWHKDQGPPIFGPGMILAPSFISVAPSIEGSSLTQIYLLLLSPLVLLGLLPSVFSRIAAARELSRMSQAIETVGAGSSLQGKQCPNEIGPGSQSYLFQAGDTVLVCPKCNTAHHLSCWKYNQHQCMNRVCEYQFEIPARVLARYGIPTEEKQIA